MKFAVNENCIACGLCVSICPEVFALNDEGVSQAKQQPKSKDEEERAEKALEDGPVDAIEHA